MGGRPVFFFQKVLIVIQKNSSQASESEDGKKRYKIN